MTDDKLKQLEAWAELPFTIQELAILTETSAAFLRVAMQDDNSKIGNAIKRGRLRTKAEFYEAVIKLSNQGSGPAQTMMQGFLQRMDS